MVKAQESLPEFEIDDLTVPPYTQEMKDHHEEPLAYHAVLRQGDVQASLVIRNAQENRLYPGGYAFWEQMIDRVNPLAPGAMGRKQEARARTLQPLLLERVKASLTAARWEQPWKAQGVDYWLYVGLQTQAATAVQEQGQVAPPARQNTIVRSTRLITFVCEWCRQEVTEQRYPSHTPLYCSNPTCKREATRKKRREYMAVYYKAHPEARKKKA